MEKLKRKVPRFSEDDKINEAYYNAIKTLDTTDFCRMGDTASGIMMNRRIIWKQRKN